MEALINATNLSLEVNIDDPTALTYNHFPNPNSATGAWGWSAQDAASKILDLPQQEHILERLGANNGNPTGSDNTVYYAGEEAFAIYRGPETTNIPVFKSVGIPLNGQTAVRLYLRAWSGLSSLSNVQIGTSIDGGAVTWSSLQTFTTTKKAIGLSRTAPAGSSNVHFWIKGATNGQALIVDRVGVFLGTTGSVAWNEPQWVEVLTDTSSVSVKRAEMEVGTMDAHIRSATLDPAKANSYLRKGAKVRLTGNIASEDYEDAYVDAINLFADPVAIYGNKPLITSNGGGVERVTGQSLTVQGHTVNTAYRLTNATKEFSYEVDLTAVPNGAWLNILGTSNTAADVRVKGAWIDTNGIEVLNIFSGSHAGIHRVQKQSSHAKLRVTYYVVSNTTTTFSFLLTGIGVLYSPTNAYRYEGFFPEYLIGREDYTWPVFGEMTDLLTYDVNYRYGYIGGHRTARFVPRAVPAGTVTKTIFAGTISRATTQYNRDDKPDITLFATDVLSKVATAPLRQSYASLEALGSVLGAEGIPYSVNGETAADAITEPVQTTDNDFKIIDHVIRVRDTHTAYAWVNNDGILNVYDNALLPEKGNWVFSDVAAPATLSYTALDKGYDTDGVVNSITLNVFKDVEVETSFDDANGNPVNFIALENKSTKHGPYVDEASVRAYGEYRYETDVNSETGNGTLDPAAWSAEVLSRNAVPQVVVREMQWPVKDGLGFATAVQSDLFDTVSVTFDGETTHGLRITTIEHDIRPGKWNVTYGFTQRTDTTIW